MTGATISRGIDPNDVAKKGGYITWFFLDREMTLRVAGWWWRGGKIGGSRRSQGIWRIGSGDGVTVWNSMALGS